MRIYSIGPTLFLTECVADDAFFLKCLIFFISARVTMSYEVY